MIKLQKPQVANYCALLLTCIYIAPAYFAEAISYHYGCTPTCLHTIVRSHSLRDRSHPEHHWGKAISLSNNAAPFYYSLTQA